uniref:Lipase 3 n=1 Tax=Cacopsylla melanoneura TaxID=428564 RepID=A0A8D8QSG9_9HEMI
MLLHGMTATSDCWLVVGPTHDLAFLLWKLGYDVWMWNARGNMYSNEHVKYKYNQERFFNFSVHDYGYYDTPATIDYILNVTNQKTLITLGHSMGAGMYLLAGSTRPEYQKKVLLNILWGQAIMMEHIRQKRRIKLGFKLHKFGNIFKNELHFARPGSQLSELKQFMCDPTQPRYVMCLWFMGRASGPGSNQTNTNAVLKMMTKFPAGASFDVMHQMNQNIDRGEFAPLSYGRSKNLKIYGTVIPPPYPIGKIATPTAIYYGCCNDFLSSAQVRVCSSE